MNSLKQRIDYIDFVKGWGIFLVIWVHTDYPFWVTPNFVNSFFFFTSGFFFKKDDFGNFTKKQVNRLLIPFVFFYLISYPFRIVFHYWDFRTLSDFDWWCIFDIFDSVGRSDYLFVNVPLWFILCIVVVRYYYWFVYNFNKYVLFVLSIILLLSRSLIYSIATPFMINNAVYWLGFFILGNLYGKKLIEILLDLRSRIIVFTISGICSLFLFLSEDFIVNELLLNFIVHLERLAIIVFTISVFAFFNGKSYMKPFKFMGESSLQILGYHILILVPFGRIAYRVTRQHEPWIGFICAVLTTIVLFFIIRFSNKYIPQFVGKRNLIK